MKHKLTEKQILASRENWHYAQLLGMESILYNIIRSVQMVAKESALQKELLKKLHLVHNSVHEASFILKNLQKERIQRDKEKKSGN